MGWIPYINAVTNSIYYVHSETQESAWSLPSGTTAEWREPAVGDIVILSTTTENDKVLGDVSEQNRGTVVKTSPRGPLNVEVNFNDKTAWYNRYSLLVVSTVADRQQRADVTVWELTEAIKRVADEQEKLKEVLNEATAAKQEADAALAAAGREPTQQSAVLEKAKCVQRAGSRVRRRFKSRRAKKSQRTKESRRNK
jgi:hypothetical protein